MTEYIVDSWDEMQSIKAEAGDTVTLRGTGFSYVAVVKPKTFADMDGTYQIKPEFSHYQRIPKKRMTYPSQAIYKPRAK